MSLYMAQMWNCAQTMCTWEFSDLNICEYFHTSNIRIFADANVLKSVSTDEICTQFFPKIQIFVRTLARSGCVLRHIDAQTHWYTVRTRTIAQANTREYIFSEEYYKVKKCMYVFQTSCMDLRAHAWLDTIRSSQTCFFVRLLDVICAHTNRHTHFVIRRWVLIRTFAICDLPTHTHTKNDTEVVICAQNWICAVSVWNYSWHRAAMRMYVFVCECIYACFCRAYDHVCLHVCGDAHAPILSCVHVCAWRIRIPNTVITRWRWIHGHHNYIEFKHTDIIARS